MDSNLTGLIDRATYVSFDIFDTAVLRALRRPTDLFDLVERRFDAEKDRLTFDYKAFRVESEKRARKKAWNQKGAVEITLDEIYRSMEEDFGVSRDMAEDLKRFEVDVEIKICVANRFIYSAYRYCINNKKRVVFTSDMYLPTDVLTTILEKTGYTEIHKMFVSSSLGATKSAGGLYELLLRDLSCEPREVLHIGDHYDSDVTMAERYGISTCYYEKCRDRALKDRSSGKSHLDEMRAKTNGAVEESIYAATVMNKFYSERGPRGSRTGDDFWYGFGYKYVGVLFFGFSAWLLEQVKRDCIEKIYFLSRDGYIMKRVYDFVSQSIENAVPSSYMYASRRALNIPGITELDDHAIDFLVSGTSTLNVAQFLERLGFSPARFTTAIREAGFSSADDKIITGRDYGMLRALFLIMADDIKKVAAQERRALLDYFNALGIFETRKIAVVDIGWHGTLQTSISKIVELSGRKVEIKGYYLGTFRKAMELCRNGQDIGAYLCEFGRPGSFYDIIKLCVEILEFIHTAPHGSVIRFESVNGDIEPVFDQDDSEPERIEKARALQEGALDFIEDFVACWKSFSFLNVSQELAIGPLSRVLRYPTYQEAVKLGDLEHAEGFGAVYVKRRIAKPPAFMKSLVYPYRVLKGYKQAFWRTGYKRRVFSLGKVFGRGELH
jgi:predicted HAD superfamily hydrolase